MGTIVNTYGGGRFDLAAPHWNHVRLTDIAVSLSRLNRFNGHTDGGTGRLMPTWGGVWSVAQHSLYVRDLIEEFAVNVPLAVARAYAVLHDAHEYLTGDVIAPVKQAMSERGFDFEARIAAPIQRAIHESFVLPEPGPVLRSLIHTADRRAGEIEKRLLMDGLPVEEWLRPSITLRLAPPEQVAELFEQVARADLRAATKVIAGDIAAESALRLEADAARHAGAADLGGAAAHLRVLGGEE